ncbi:hypothetical protein [Halobaculum sp. P14]|uniref:hypothetical protein n=1 Tax=Halobaculum sp. P14 TaxID=3421638 RepID=UPI003EB886D0
MAVNEGEQTPAETCRSCGQPLADHGLAAEGPATTVLAPCGRDVTALPLRTVARLLRDSTAENPAHAAVTDGGVELADSLTLDADGLEMPADVDLSEGVVFRIRGATIDMKPGAADRDRYPLINRRSLEAEGQHVVNGHIGIREVSVKPYGDDPTTYRVTVEATGGDGQ